MKISANYRDSFFCQKSHTGIPSVEAKTPQKRKHKSIQPKMPSTFAIKCQKVLANCAKAMYNDRAILWKAYLCIIKGGLENVK